MNTLLVHECVRLENRRLVLNFQATKTKDEKTREILKLEIVRLTNEINKMHKTLERK